MAMVFPQVETERVNQIVNQGGRSSLTELEFYALEITEWKGSPVRQEQIIGERYYRGQQDILERKRMVIGGEGKLVPVENLPNNQVIDNQYAKMVDQKVNYLLGKPLSLNGDDEAYIKLLKGVFGRRFQRQLKYLCEDSITGGIGWLFVYYDKHGKLSFRRFPAYEILPFWADDDHSELNSAARLYLQEVWDGHEKKVIERVEIFKSDGIYRYILDGFLLVPDIELGEYSAYLQVQDGAGNVTPYNWDRIPLIPFKYNKQEIPMLRRVKSLQDGINAMMSDFENNMQEDARTTILILKNYDGQDLAEFRYNLAMFGAIKVRSTSDVKGDVESLQIEVNAEKYRAILEVFKNALIENARGFDAKDDRLKSGQPNQMNIQSMYSDIDLDANGMESEWQAGFEDLLWFINQDFANRGKGNFDGAEVVIVFDRDILINESEAIDNAVKSAAILSLETIVEQHPWPIDAKTELARIKKERQQRADDDYEATFSKAPPGGERS